MDSVNGATRCPCMTRTPSCWKGRMGRKSRLQSCGSRTFLCPVMALILNLRLWSWVVSFAPRWFFAECPVVLEFWQLTAGFILREFDVKIKLHCTDIMLGVQRPNMQTYYIKKINHVILIAKMCISIFNNNNNKTTKSPFSLVVTFEK